MKKLVIFYSFSGNTRLIAETIATATDADLLELKPKKEIPSHGFMKYVAGGKAALTKASPELMPLDKNSNDYDVLFIGTPVWAWTYAPALRSFFAAHPIAGKKIALFCCHGGGKGGIFTTMKDAVPGNQILGEIDFRDPLKNNTAYHIETAKKWAEDMMKGYE